MEEKVDLYIQIAVTASCKCKLNKIICNPTDGPTEIQHYDLKAIGEGIGAMEKILSDYRVAYAEDKQ